MLILIRGDVETEITTVVTTEIAIVKSPDYDTFGRPGDSGSLVVEDVDGDLYAVGMLIAITDTGLGLMTPIQAILDDVKEKTGEIITIARPTLFTPQSQTD